MRSPVRLLVLLMVPAAAAAQSSARPSNLLPPAAAASLVRSLEAARGHVRSPWRDIAPFNADDTVTAYIEIPRGDRRKWEFDMAGNARAIDRVMPREVGAYPVNYGFVPQTISYDGDPFDALVLGPPLGGGAVVRGAIVGLMLMEDEKGHDSKVVLSPVDAAGNPRYVLDAQVREQIADYFRRYKAHDPGAFSRVPGWASPTAGRAYVATTHAFFARCRNATDAPCRVD